eukprot:2264444-Rhodomonas_salina.1
MSGNRPRVCVAPYGNTGRQRVHSHLRPCAYPAMRRVHSLRKSTTQPMETQLNTVVHGWAGRSGRGVRRGECDEAVSQLACTARSNHNSRCPGPSCTDSAVAWYLDSYPSTYLGLRDWQGRRVSGPPQRTGTEDQRTPAGGCRGARRPRRR